MDAKRSSDASQKAKIHMKKCIYTVIIGRGIDDLKPPAVLTPGWDYVCLTDQKLEPVKGWRIIRVPLLSWGAVKTARYYKINFLEILDVELSIFVDATFFINTNLDEWCAKYHKYPFTVISHPVDDCLFIEAQNCLRMGKGEAKAIHTQIAKYSSEGMPKNNGLISSGILIRNNNKAIESLCREWWSQVEQYSSRDQISFSYCRWIFNYYPHSITWDYRIGTEFFHIPHLYKIHRQDRLIQFSKLQLHGTGKE